MSDVSRIIRERAMAIMRETRAKIDPALLRAMKDHISIAMPHLEQEMAQAAPKKPSASKTAAAPQERKYIPPVMEEKAPVKASADDSAEPVDKQKIAQIVVNYMKHKDGGVRH